MMMVGDGEIGDQEKREEEIGEVCLLLGVGSHHLQEVLLPALYLDVKHIRISVPFSKYRFGDFAFPHEKKKGKKETVTKN